MKPCFDINYIHWHALESDCSHSGLSIAGLCNLDKFEALSEFFQSNPRELDLAKLYSLLKELSLNVEIFIKEHAENVLRCNARHDKIGVQSWFESRKYSLERLERDLHRVQEAKAICTRWLDRLQGFMPLQQIIKTSIRFNYDNTQLSEDKLKTVPPEILEKKPILLGDLLDSANPENSDRLIPKV